MRIDEAGDDDVVGEVEFAGAAGFAEAFDLAARADGGDASIANEERAIADDSGIAERPATARYGSAKSEKLSAARHESVLLPRLCESFVHGCQRY